MSGLAAVFTRSTRPAPPAVLERMLGAMAGRGPDGRGVCEAGPAAIGHLALHTTREAAAERQPYADAHGVTVALHGLLTNRDDLTAQLDGVDMPAGDAALVAAAYDRWGIEFARHLCGEFAFIVWDPRQRLLLAGRDVMAGRPLFYAHGADGSLLAATEPRALLASGLVDDAVNDARLLDHVAGLSMSATETLYAAIHRVAPGSVVVASRADVAARRYWDFPVGTLRYPRTADYVEHAGELLRRVVRSHLHAAATPGLLLSGGIDSSALAALAAASGIRCEAITMRCPGTPFDETGFASQVARACGMRHHLVDLGLPPAAWYRQQIEEHRDLPEAPNSALLEPARQAARGHGIRVVLGGAGGDEWFTGSPYHYADWLRRGRLDRVLRQVASDAVFRGPGIAADELLLSGVWPLLPARARGWIKAALPRRDGLPPWIAGSAADRARLRERVGRPVRRRRGESFVQADLRRLASDGHRIESADLENRAAARAGLEVRSPLNDRRVIEFALALPEDVRWRGRWRKYLLRAVTRGVLPEAVRRRRSKAEFSATLVDTMASWDGGGGFPELTARGLVVPDAAADARRQLEVWWRAGDARVWSMVWPVWKLTAAEYWLAQRGRRTHG